MRPKPSRTGYTQSTKQQSGIEQGEIAEPPISTGQAVPSAITIQIAPPQITPQSRPTTLEQFIQ